MFTGIVKGTARVHAIEIDDGDGRFTFVADELRFDDVALGDSIAVNGCCLTVVDFANDRFSADVSRETLSATTLGAWRVGSVVNLEPALKAGEPLGGHMVSGHVDGVARITGRSEDGESWRFRFAPPKPLLPYLARKGSVTIDGVSLTVNDVAERDFGVNIVPHTFTHTTFGHYALDGQVNIEVDLVARYIERLMEARS